jgi:hypothetical protein
MTPLQAHALENPMMHLRFHATALLAMTAMTALTCAAQTPQWTVVPAAYATDEAVSYEWIAGASDPQRQQTLVGASHLQPLLGREIWGIDLRRTAKDELYHGGSTYLIVTLSTAARAPLAISTLYAHNSGTDSTVVFHGSVTIPTSPAVTTATVPWTPENIVHIQFQTPFVYTGGTLCIDVLGQPIQGQQANWWMADAEFEDIAGQARDLGGGCGIYGGPSRAWSSTAVRTLIPGAYALFSADGPASGFALAVVGGTSPAPIPLTTFGVGQPGCDLHVDPSLVVASVVVPFVPLLHPLLQGRGVADLEVKLPAAPWVFGLTLTTQWIELSQMATSNAIEWEVAHQIPSLDMALVEGHPSEPAGNVSVHLAHVLRFEHRAP